MSKVWETPMLSSTDKLVLLALADNSNDEGICWPSIATIVKKTDLSERSVHYSIERLKTLKFIAVDSKPGSSNIFRLLIGGCTTCTPGVHQLHRGGAPVAPDPSYNRQRTIKGEGTPPVAGAKKPEVWQLTKDRERIRKQLKEAKESAVPDAALVAGLVVSLKSVNEAIRNLGR